jgi:hypothetical protein
MEWTDQQRAELAADLLALFRRIPDGAGRAGYFAELAKLSR